MSSTKQKIIEAAVGLFNKRGVAEVTLRDIARKINISTGNLAYHFKNKDFIIKEAFHQMEEERERMLSGVQQIPSFENINRQLLPMLKLHRKYRFVYLDTVELMRKYPTIAKLHRQYIDGHIAYIKAMLDYSVGTGNMKSEEEKGTYQSVAETVWMILYFWLSKEEIRSNRKASIRGAGEIMWKLVTPYLTEKGQIHFEKIMTSDKSISV